MMDLPYSWPSPEAQAIWDTGERDTAMVAALLLLADRVGLLIDSLDRRRGLI